MKSRLNAVVLAVVVAAAPLSYARADAIFGFTAVGNPPAVVGNQQLVINGSTTLNASFTGWYDFTGFHDATNPDYAVGSGILNTRDFFVFDLTHVTGPISSATLSLWNPSGGFLLLGDGDDLYTNWDVTTRISDLEANNSGAISIWSDLGSGVAYGSVTVSAADDGTMVNISLNANALAALIAAEGGQFAIGGAMNPVGVPGPVSGAGLPGLLFVGGGLLGWWRRKRRASENLAAA